MYTETIETMGKIAAIKADMARRRLPAYLVHSALAGVYVGFGIILIITLGAPLYAQDSPFTPTVMGAAFAIALSLVVIAGADHFAGNAMTMPLGIWLGRTGWIDLARVWGWSYFGNFIGSLLLAVIVVLGGTLGKDPGLHFATALAAKKMELSFSEAFFRGILCNWLGCLAVWSAYRVKSESAKLIMIFLCLLAFIGSGFEHSVANMTVMSLANLLPHGPEISWSGMFHNLLPVTLGNIVAGSLFTAGAYWMVNRAGERVDLQMDSSAPAILASAPAANIDVVPGDATSPCQGNSNCGAALCNCS